MNLYISITVNSFCFFFLTSCGEDPKLVAVSKQQKSEISRLSAKLAYIEEKLSHMPNDYSAELVIENKKAEQQKIEIANLEAEISRLGERKDSLSEEYKSYRIKYQIK